LKSTKTGGKTRSIKVPGATELLAQRKAAKLGGLDRVLTKQYEWFKGVFKTVSESLDIPYGQRVPGGWTIHDLRHTCLSNLALEGMPLHAIKEFAGHSDIRELGAKTSSRLGLLAGAKLEHPEEAEIQCPNCSFCFSTRKTTPLKLAQAP
jgi:integrase